MADLQAGTVQQHVDAAALLQRGPDRLCHLGRVCEVGLVPVRRAAGRADRLEGVERRALALEAAELALDHLGRRLLAGLADPVGDRALEPVAVRGEGLEVWVRGVGSRHEVHEVEGPAGAPREVGRDRRDDASGSTRDEEHGVLRQLAGRIVLGRALLEAHGPAQAVGAADLHGPGVAQGLLDERGRDRRGIILRRKIDRLDQCVRALARQRLGEAGHGAAQDGRRSGRVVAVTAAEAGR